MNIYIVGSLLFSAVMVLFITMLFIKNIKLKKANRLLLASLKNIEYMVEFVKKDTVDNDIHKENFIKFISDSRDWAYEYIESVQDGLSTFINAVKPDIEYFNEYGGAALVGPDHDIIKRIAIAYEDLIKLMPDEEKK
jgi:putative ribosome biogenesis GTPase RsgA